MLWPPLLHLLHGYNLSFMPLLAHFTFFALTQFAYIVCLSCTLYMLVAKSKMGALLVLFIVVHFCIYICNNTPTKNIWAFFHFFKHEIPILCMFILFPPPLTAKKMQNCFSVSDSSEKSNTASSAHLLLVSPVAPLKTYGNFSI